MKKTIFILFLFLAAFTISHAQFSGVKKIFIIDSAFFLTEREVSQQLLPGEIADTVFISNRDSVARLAGKPLDAVVYLFTKEYRQRPDSLKAIPAFKQMSRKEGSWTWRGRLYTGPYIDYYANGKMQGRGRLVNGQLEGERIIYYPNGNIKSWLNYESGQRHGTFKEYYKNGALLQEGEFSYGKISKAAKHYFSNGQVKQEVKPKRVTGYDTVVVYFSTGKVKLTRTSKTGNFYPDDKEIELTNNSAWFYRYLNDGDLKQANKYFYKIWQIDSASIDTHFEEGVLMMHEFRFEEAILHFDRVLDIEPLMPEALEQRALARLKKYKYPDKRMLRKEQVKDVVVVDDIMLVPEYERTKVCRDLLRANEIDPSVNFNNRVMQESVLRYCTKDHYR